MISRKLRLGASVAALATALALPAAAEVTLQTDDSTIKISGELLGYDGEYYTIRSSIGTVRLNAAIVNCFGDECPQAGGAALDLKVAINDATAGELMGTLANAYAKRNDLSSEQVVSQRGDVTRVSFSTDNEPKGGVELIRQSEQASFAALARGEVQFVLTTQPVTDATVETLAAAGIPDPREAGENVIALDALVPVTHPDNEIRSLTTVELAQVFAGRIRNWSELGGPDMPIEVLLPAADLPIAQEIERSVLRPNRLRASAAAERFDSLRDLAAEVSERRGAISLISAGRPGPARTVPVRQVCGPLAYAGEFEVRAEEYPLARRVYLYQAGGNISGGGDEFLDFLTSDDAQAVLEGSGFVGQDISVQPINVQGTRFATALISADSPERLTKVRDLSAELAASDRVSTTFRFRSGSSQLDAKAAQDIERIADFLTSKEIGTREVTLIGFTDDVGRDDLNEQLALQRAERIREAILLYAGGRIPADRVRVKSYGELAPVGCNETPEGRNANRRVEVWID